MAKLVSLVCLMTLAVLVCFATAANTRSKYNDGRYNPYFNDAYYTSRYYRNREYYNKRRYYDNFFKKYNPNVAAQQARIVDQAFVPQNAGDYSYSYETENGIHGEENGYAVRTGNGEQKEQVQGAYSYLSPEGLRVGVKYTADENGFHPIITYDGVNGPQYANLQQPADVILTRFN